MLRTETREINGKKFQISQLPAMRALRLSTRLGKLFGPPLAKVAGTSPTTQGIASVNVGALAPAIASLFETLSESELESLTRELLCTTMVEHDGAWVELFGHSPVFDLVMGGDVLGIFKLLYAAIEVNYSDFFGEFRGIVAAGAKAFRSVESKPSKTDGQPSA